jgi:hypothetical protein
MLVPAMAFAWWLVSFPSPAAAASAAATTHDRAATEMQAQADRQEWTRAVAPSAAALHAQAAYETSERVRIKVVTPDIVREAQSYLGVAMHSKLPIGSEHDVTIDGQRYVLRIEWHYHPAGFVGAPNGWHHGVTVYELR